MESKINIEYDFDTKEPYLQLRLAGHDVDFGDMRDAALKNFIELANIAGGMVIEYRGAGNGLPQIRAGVRPNKE